MKTTEHLAATSYKLASAPKMPPKKMNAQLTIVTLTKRKNKVPKQHLIKLIIHCLVCISHPIK
jgi:hypothetical protein